MISVIFAEGYISHYNNFHTTKKTRKLNELVEELWNKHKPDEAELKDVIIIDDWVKSGYNTHSRHFRFKFKIE